MAIGNQTTVSITSLNAEIGQVATDMHDSNTNAADFFERVNALGVAGLVTIGFTQVDAQAFFDTANDMNHSSEIWFGIVNLPAAYNFDNATAKAR